MGAPRPRQGCAAKPRLLRPLTPCTGPVPVLAKNLSKLQSGVYSTHGGANLGGDSPHDFSAIDFNTDGSANHAEVNTMTMPASYS